MDKSLTIPPATTLSLSPKAFIWGYMGGQQCLVNLDQVVAIFITQEPGGAGYRLVCETVRTGMDDNRFVLARASHAGQLSAMLRKLADEMSTHGWRVLEVKPPEE
jgi:hypothetical protein